MRIDLDGICRDLTAVAEHYEKSAPTVADWANDLYVRIGDSPDTVTLTELRMVTRMADTDGGWTHPNVAANLVYKLMNRLGRDTTGHAGF